MGVRMNEALDDDGCEIVRNFFQFLLRLRRDAAKNHKVAVHEALGWYRKKYATKVGSNACRELCNKRKLITPELLERSRELRESGLMHSEVADIVGIKAGTISSWCQIYGIHGPGSNAWKSRKANTATGKAS